MPSRLRSLVRALTLRRRFEDGMAEELRFHLDEYTRDLVRSGVPEAEAARRARLEFGGIDTVKEDCREARGLRPFDHAAQDVRQAVRLMRRTPGVTIAALATLAICLGATLAVFAVVDAVLVRPLPYPDPDRLVTVFNTYPAAGVPDDGASVTNYYERRGRIRALERLALYRDGAVVVGDTGRTERAFITRVTPGFFGTLGVTPAMGRTFTDDELQYGADHVVVLTDASWRARFGASPQALGAILRVDGLPYTVIGVLPPSFEFLKDRPFFLPLASPPDERGPDRRHSGSSSHMIARLAPGVPITEAQAQVDAHNAAMEATDPQAQFIADAGFRSLVVPFRASYVAEVRPMLLVTQAGAVCLLMLGAVNVAGLLLVRAAGRVKELAVRQALGAGRGRVAGEVFVETLLITVAGGLLALAVGAGGVALLRELGADRLPLGSRVQFDWRLAAAGLDASVGLGVAIAVPVAWYHLRSHVAGALGAVSRGHTAGRGTERLRHALLVAQIALALTLTSGAGLLALSLQHLSDVPPGIRPDRVVTGQVSLPYQAYPSGESRVAFFDRLAAALGAQPGVASVGIATNIPFSGNRNKSSATVQGRAPKPGEPPHGLYTYAVAGDYFSSMGLSLVSGRFLTADDARTGTHVCVIDSDLARRYWPRGEAVGHVLFSGSEEGPPSDAFRIVGVVSPVKQAGLADDEALGAVYFPYESRFDSAVYVIVRSTRDAGAVGAMLQRAVRGLDPELPVNNVRSMDRRIADSLMTRRSPAVLAVLFAAMALLLTTIGTYGVVSYAVALRRREIGLRIALGAPPAAVRRQFVLVALRLLAAGAAVGLAGAWATGRAMQALLFGVRPFDLRVVAGAAALLAIVCIVACLVPAARAARVSPVETLAEL